MGEVDIVIGKNSVNHLINMFEEKRAGRSFRKSKGRPNGLEKKDNQEKKSPTLGQDDQTVHIDSEETLSVA